MRFRFHRVAATAALLLIGASALAQPAQPSSSEVSLAREQFRQGIAFGEHDQWPEAREAFERSYHLYPRPLTLLNLAAACGHTGRVVQAAEYYRQFLREATGGPAARQRDAATQGLADVERRIARARVQIQGLDAADRVQIDEVTVSHAALGMDLPLDPGAHVLVVFRGEAQVSRTPFSLSDGQSTGLVVDVAAAAARAVPNSAHAEASPAPAASTPPPSVGRSILPPPDGQRRVQRPSSGGVPTWVWVVGGVVVIGAASAAVYYGVSSNSQPVFYMGNTTPNTVVIR